jgi:type IV pilus assembly protein PilW
MMSGQKLSSGSWVAFGKALKEMRTRDVRDNETGFTLIELLVAMALGLVVLASVLHIFVHQNQTSKVQTEVAYAQQNVRGAMTVMTREIRAAGYDPEDNGFDAIQTATASSIRVLSNLSGDNEAGDPDDADEDVTYAMDNGNRELTRNGNTAIQNVVPNSLQFTYTFSDGDTGIPDETDGDTTNDLDDIRSVAVQLQVHTETEDPHFADGYDLNPGTTGTCRTRTLFTRVRIRNMGFEDLE